MSAPMRTRRELSLSQVVMVVAVIVAAVLAVRVIVPRVLAILRTIMVVALARARLSGGHYAALQHSSV